MYDVNAIGSMDWKTVAAILVLATIDTIDNIKARRFR